MANVHNVYQDAANYKRVLCVCSAGLLRSPTIAHVLSQEPYNFNTRAVGAVKEFALIPVDEVLLEWADEVVCAEDYHADIVRQIDPDVNIKVLDIPDRFPYRDAELVAMIRRAYDRK